MFRRVAPLAFMLALFTPSAHARLPSDAPPLPPPSGMTIVNVSTAQELADACWNLASNEAIVVAPGTYHLDDVDFPNGVDGRLTVGHFGAAPISNIEIRGATGNPADVVILGAGMLDATVPFGFQVFTATDVTIADLSIGNVYYHALAVQGDQGAQRVRVHHARLFDAGPADRQGRARRGQRDDRIFRAVPERRRGQSSRRLAARQLLHERDRRRRRRALDRARQPDPRHLVPGSHARGSRRAALAGSSDTIVERNTILDSSRGISLGLTGADDHSGGYARNNFIRWDADAPYAIDVPIYTTSPNSAILQNTALTLGRYANAVEVRFAGATGVRVENNLLDAAIRARDGATPTLAGNLLDAMPAWFVDVGSGDLHLSAAATPAIDQGTRLDGANDDFDAQARPDGTGQADIGADERAAGDAIFADGFDGD